MSLLGDAGTVRVRLDGERVTVTMSDGTRREWRDVLAFVVEKGKRQVVAVGETEEELRRGASAAEQGALAKVRFVRALAPLDFDHEVAQSFFAYVLVASRIKGGRIPVFRKPRVELELPGYAGVAEARQLAFEDHIRIWGDPTLVNGVPARPLSPWIARLSWVATLFMALGVVAYWMAARNSEGRAAWLVGFASALALAGLVSWWGEHLKKALLRDAGSGR